MLPWIAGSAALGFVVVFNLIQRYRNNVFYGRSRPLPPGPPGLPFLGNVLGINGDAPWLTYAEWAKKYGDLVYTRLFGREIIIINSETIARELLENRSYNYSDRPYMITNELCGLEFNSGLLPYGDKWRLHRRFFHQTFRSAAVARFLPLQHRLTCQLLRHVLVAPDQLDEHTFEYTTSITLNSIYDYDASSGQEGLFQIVRKVLDTTAIAGRPDVAIIVGAFPAILKLPSWLPGMSFKKKMDDAKEFSKEYVERPFEYTLHRMASGSSSPAMVYDGLKKLEEQGNAADETWMTALKGASATGFLAASETSHSVLMIFFLMMVVAPEVQEKAQAQIDEIVGRNRLPTIEDRPLLPYVSAVYRETLRHTPVAPLSVPHAALNDDIYAGFHIPKGAILLTNIWSMAHDESKYPNPNEFIPERFLNDDGSLKPADIENIVFGFGRRICVGRYFADMSVWSVIAKFLAVFKILKPLDENGAEIPVEPKFSSGVAIHPLPFGFRIVPRYPGMDSKKLEELIAVSTT